MGTISGYRSRQDVVDDLVKQYSGDRFSIIDRKATNFGRHLWMLIKPKEGPSFVCLFKLSSYGGDWGYKAIDESMGPVYYDCPVSLLKQADCPTTEFATDWRDEVYRLNGIHDYCDDYKRTNNAMDALSESMNTVGGVK